MDKLTAFYQLIDPLKPLEATEQDLYVDWQKALGADDVKGRLIRSLARSGDLPYTRLFTGHRGCGKTTELYRVKHGLETGAAPRKLFVSFVEAERWLDLADVQPQDVVYHMVWQLLADLDARAGIGFGLTKFKQFLGSLLDRIKALQLEGMEISTDPVSLSIALKEVPGARAELRKLLEERLPRIYDLVNNEILKPAREELRKKGYDDVLIIVDQLDRVPQKVLHEDLTNHESLFLDQAGILRALNCGVLYTIPIELAYSRCRIRLRNTYGSEVLSLPVLPVLRRDGSPNKGGVRALCEIVQRRAARAGLKPGELMNEPSLERLCRLSGGHVRSLFVMLREALDRCDTLPVPPASPRAGRPRRRPEPGPAPAHGRVGAPRRDQENAGTGRGRRRGALVRPAARPLRFLLSGRAGPLVYPEPALGRATTVKAAAAVDLTLQNRVELKRLCNLLRRAGGFALAFASVAHRRLRERLVAAIRSELPDTEIVEVTLQPGSSIVAQLETASGRAPGAMFVFGLETLLDLTRAESQPLAMLNLNRGYCIRRFPWPVVFFGPRFVLREFARQAIDTWSGRSGVYHFEGTGEEARATLAEQEAGYDWSLGLKDKRERKEVLLQVLAELEPAGASRELAEVLYLLARAAGFEGDGAAQAQYLERALSLYREIGDRLGEADCIQSLGDVALRRARYKEAESRYQAALAIYREIGALIEQANSSKALGDVAFSRSRYVDAEAGYETALSVYRGIGDRLGEANCIRSLGDVAWRRGASYEDAEARYETALSVYTEIGDRFGVAKCIKSLGDVALRRARYEEAESHYQAALSLYREIGERLGEADCSKALGDVARNCARYDEAEACYQLALPLYQEIGDRRGEATCLRTLGHMALRRARYEEAESHYQAALSLYREIGERLGEANCIRNLGNVALRRARYEDAEAHYETALPLYREIGARLGEAHCIQSLGDLARMRGRYEDAEAHYETAVPLYREIGARLGEAHCIKRLGDVALQRAWYENAQARYETALSLYREIGDRLGEANCIKSLGDVALQRARYDEARARYQAALPLYREMGDRLGEAGCLYSHAELLRSLDRTEGARAAFAEAARIYADIGVEDRALRAREAGAALASPLATRAAG
ncbi:MAG: tetratricopeptide repeat protein [Gammaproteobacteria bacterium]